MKKNKLKVSPETIVDASKMAKATQREGQTKEQTKLIAQGVQKGIDHYKKQQKSKARELDKKLRKVRGVNSIAESQEGDSDISQVKATNAKLPWVLLILSWLAFASYFIVFK